MVEVCIVGAGPSGMGLLAMFNRLQGRGTDVEVTCYEKQETGNSRRLVVRTLT